MSGLLGADVSSFGDVCSVVVLSRPESVEVGFVASRLAVAVSSEAEVVVASPAFATAVVLSSKLEVVEVAPASEAVVVELISVD